MSDEDDDFDGLLTVLFGIGHDLLRDERLVPPIGAGVELGGKPRLFAAGEEAEEAADADDLIPQEAMLDAIYDKIRAEADSLRAIAVMSGVQIASDDTDASDAIEVRLEHRDGTALTVYEPYELRRFRSPKFGERFAQDGELDVFRHLANPS